MHDFYYMVNDPYSEFEPEPLYLPLERPEEPISDLDEKEDLGSRVIIIEMCPEG